MDFVAEQSVASLTKKEQPLRAALLRKVRFPLLIASNRVGNQHLTLSQ